MPFIVTSGGGVNVLTVPGGYSVMEDTGIIEANPEQGPTASVRYKCLAQDRYSFVKQLLGQWNGTPPSSFSYVGPFQYPPSPNLFCTSIDSIQFLGKPIPDSVAGLPYLVKKYAIVQANFTRPTWQPATSGGYFSITFAGSGEVFTVPETVYRFGDGTPTATPLGIQIPQAEIIVKRFRMPFIPDQEVFILLATPVNNAAFQIGNNIYPAGTLLFSAGNSTTESDVLGNLTYTFEYRFLARAVPWNYSFHPNRTTGFAAITDGNGNFPFTPGNFNILP